MSKVRVSQQQIARDLGVSQTLVSMVLNGRRKGVSADAYEKIWKCARESGYRPKGIAPELLAASSGVKSVGFVLRAGAKIYSQSPFFGHVQHGIHDCLVEHGVALHFMGMETDFDLKRLEHLRDPESFLGLVILGEVSRSFLRSLLKLESRIITISSQFSGLCDSVLPNEDQAADLLVQHLVDLGHQSFAWVGGNLGMQRSQSRLRAIQNALNQRNASIDPKFCVEVESGDRLQGRQVAQALLEAAGNAPLPTAWICFNGVMARGAVSCLSSKGLDVPGDVSIVAFDATRVCEDEHPTLTGAATSPELLGRVAAENLLQMKGRDRSRFTDTVLAAELVVRESSGQARQATSSRR